MTLDTNFSDMKFFFVSYPVFLVINGCNVSVPFGTPCIIDICECFLNLSKFCICKFKQTIETFEQIIELN